MTPEHLRQPDKDEESATAGQLGRTDHHFVIKVDWGMGKEEFE